jgi:hypothetical protein
MRRVTSMVGMGRSTRWSAAIVMGAAACAAAMPTTGRQGAAGAAPPSYADEVRPLLAR